MVPLMYRIIHEINISKKFLKFVRVTSRDSHILSRASHMLATDERHSENMHVTRESHARHA